MCQKHIYYYEKEKIFTKDLTDYASQKIFKNCLVRLYVNYNIN